MDIGKEGEPYVIEPLVEPVPGRPAAPAPQEPSYEPADVPDKTPQREPVPA